MKPARPAQRTLPVPSAAGGITRLACERLREHGLSPEPLAAKASLTMAEIENRDVRIKAQSQIQFLALAGDALADDLLGFHIAQEFDLREIGLFYYVLASATSLSDAFVNAERYSRVGNEGVVLRLRKTDARPSIAFEYAGIRRTADRHQIEFFVTTLVRICRHLTNRRIVPRQVCFSHHRGTIPEIEKFFGCPVRFSASEDKVSFLQSDVASPVVSADPYLHDLLKRSCEEALARRGKVHYGLRTVVENAIAPIIATEKVDCGTVARKLGMSRRTLIRRLASEDLSFSEIVGELRFDLARRYLEDANLSVSQIGWLVGYSEVSAFTHAFHRWAGRTPKQWRLGPETGSREVRTRGSDSR